MQGKDGGFSFVVVNKVINAKTFVMKKKLVQISFLLLSLSIVNISCKKDGGENTTAPGPDATYITDGVLCTMGISYNSVLDTLRYWSATAGRTVQGYMYGSTTKKDEVFIVINSNKSVSVKLKEPLISGGRSYLYFRSQPNNAPSASSFPEHQYLFNWSEAPSSETEFVLTRSNADKTKFTLECKTAPGQFLGTKRWANSVQAIEESMVFTTKKQEFFLLPK